MDDNIANIEDAIVNGYCANHSLRQLQIAELDLLKKLLCVCQKYNLRIYAEGGTLLGAVRHKGFIPWDDDIDMTMPRPDYDRLIEVAQQEFSSPYFLQSTYTDTLHVRGHLQLRNSTTTGILEEEYDLNINHGIFIDIFPLDAVPAEASQQASHKAELACLMQHMRNNKPFKLPVTWNPMKMLRYVKSRRDTIAYMKQNNLDNKACFRKCEDILRKNNYETAEEVGTIGFLYWHFRPRKNYDDCVMLDFEDIQIPAPAGYDQVLRICYGSNYMIPMHEPTAHTGLIFDTERPYPLVQAELKQKHSWIKDFMAEIKKRIR